MESSHGKGQRILYERQERTSMEKGQCFYIKNTRTQVRELYCHTAGSSGAHSASPNSDTESENIRARTRNQVRELNKRIKYEIDQLKLLRSNILQNPVESKTSESDMELHDEDDSARQSSAESQSSDTHDQRLNELKLRSSQEDISSLSFRIVGLKNKRYTRFEGGCNYMPRPTNRARDLNQTVYQYDYGNNTRCVACFADAQQQFEDESNCICCAMPPNVPIPCGPYQPSWACVYPHPYCPQAITDLTTDDFCRNWCTSVTRDHSMKPKKKCSGSRIRSSSKTGRALDEKMRDKVKKSGASIDSSSLDRYNVKSHEKLIKVTMRKESKSGSRGRGSKSLAGEGKFSADDQTDKTKDREYREYMDKYKKENSDTESGKEVSCYTRTSQLAPNATYTRIPGMKETTGPNETCPMLQGERLNQTGCQGSRPEKLTQTDHQCSRHDILIQTDLQCSRHDILIQTDLKRSCHGRLTQTDLQGSLHDRQPISGQERSCIDSCPGPPQSAYDKRDPTSTPDDRVGRAKDVCYKKKCSCVAQEVQTDGERTYEEGFRVAQSPYDSPDDKSIERGRVICRNKKCSCQSQKGTTDGMDSISTRDNSVERGKGVRNKKCACLSQEMQEKRPSQSNLQGSRNERLVQEKPELNRQNSNYISPISGITVKESGPDYEDSQKDQKLYQRQDSPTASSRKMYSAQSPSSQKYLKYICPGSRTEQDEQEAEAEYRSNSRRYPVGKCQCKPPSSGPMQQMQVFEKPKQEQYTGCPLKESSPFCEPLPTVARCEPPPKCNCNANRSCEHNKRSKNMKSQKQVPVNRNVDNGPRSNKYVKFPDHCDTDCSGRSLSGRNDSMDSYDESQAMSSHFGNHLSHFAGTFAYATVNNDAYNQGVPLFVCGKQTRSVTFEDESGNVRCMRHIVDHVRSTIDWEQVLNTRMGQQDRDADNTSQSDAAMESRNSTNHDVSTYPCRSNSSAGTEITCLGSDYDTDEDISSYDNDVGAVSQPNADNLPTFKHCPCMLRTYVSLASICTNSSQSKSLQQD